MNTMSKNLQYLYALLFNSYIFNFILIINNAFPQNRTYMYYYLKPKLTCISKMSVSIKNILESILKYWYFYSSQNTKKKNVKYKKYTRLSLIFSIGNFVIISAKLILKICHLYSIDTDMLCVNRVIFCFFPLCNTLLLALSNQ